MIAQQCELVVRPGAVEHGRCDAETERGLMFQSTSNSADSSMNLSVDAAEHGRCDAEAERGVMFQSRSNSADSSMNLSVDLAEQSGSIEK